MSEISTAIAEAIRSRAASATLGTYFFFWIAFHWQEIYVTFFVNQDLIYGQHGLLKNEYIAQYFVRFDSFHFYLGIIVPAVLTYLFVWWMPYALLKAYKKEQWFRVGKRIIKIEQEKRIQEDRKELAIETAQAISEELEVAKVEKAAEEIDPKIAWQKEYNRFDSQEEEYLREVLIAVYKHHGQIYIPGRYSESKPKFELSPNALRLADSMELVNMSKNGEMIELTRKGKFFASQFDGYIQ